MRDNIKNLKPYSTARDEYSGSIGIYLDANESAYENGYNRYPDPHQKELKAVISKIKDVEVENIFLGNGSDEPIDVIMRVFCEPKQDNVVAISPSYGMYGVAADINNLEYRDVALNEDFSLDVERVLAACDANSKVLMLCSPNNPSGNLLCAEKVEILLNNFNGIVVVDEAYIDFAEGNSWLKRLGEFSNLIVLQTFSKAWGMAGLRLGMAFASPEIIAVMSRVKYPYNISSLVQSVVLGRLKEEIATGNVAKQVAQIKSERARVAAILAELPKVKRVYKSDSNFLLVKVDEATPTYNMLIENGVIVRNRDSVTGCKGCLRITIGLPSENNRMLELMGADLRNSELDSESCEIADKASNDGGAAVCNCAAATTEARFAEVTRATKETSIRVSIDLDGKGESSISTGLGFFNHMLEQLIYHGGIALQVDSKGDLHVDEHHTIEDVALVLGEAFVKALGNKIGIERYGFVLPMDECKAFVLLDLGGRPDFIWDVNFTREMVGDVPTEMWSHFFKSFSYAAKCNLHIQATGENNHHKIEGVFKAFARALKMAIKQEPFSYKLPSSKGVL